jgi:cytoskeleton protein RodZ
LLKAGDSYWVPNQSNLVLLTGNAGALEILVDGKPVPDLGSPGAIRKNVTLDPDKLRQGTAAR